MTSLSKARSSTVDTIMSDAPGASAAGPSKNASSSEGIKTAVYNYCLAQPKDTAFTQAGLLAAGLFPNNSIITLNHVMHQLCVSGQLKMQELNKEIQWRLIAPNVTSSRVGLDREMQLVYDHIESAGREGMWSQRIYKSTGIHKVVMDRILKSLEQKRLIKTVPNYRHPSRKTYMLQSLQPQEDVTGGLFYTTGELDEQLVEGACDWIDWWVVCQSWWFPPPAETQGRKRKLDTAEGRHRTTATPSMTKEEAEDRRANELAKPRLRNEHMRPYPQNHTHYPTIADITNAINVRKVVNGQTMKISDTLLLADILVWDGRLERLKVRAKSGGTKEVYRAVKEPLTQHRLEATKEIRDRVQPAKANGLTEAPCGRCPVFDLCEDGGLVNAKTCPYFQEWLEI